MVVAFYGTCLALGYLLFQVWPLGYTVLGFGHAESWALVIAAINIHHFIVDAFIWRLRRDANYVTGGGAGRGLRDGAASRARDPERRVGPLGAAECILTHHADSLPGRRRPPPDRRFSPLMQGARGSPAAGWRLFLCGLAALYWELVLIRWFGSCIRVVAYYTNFVLITAFFALGAGALLSRRAARLDRLIFPALSVALLLGVGLGRFYHSNPKAADEFVWIGAAEGVELSDAVASPALGALSVALVLVLVYLATCAVFLIFGQWIGRLFHDQPPLWAYSVEIAGSICGILLFAGLSFAGASPPVWIAVGFALLAPLTVARALDRLAALGCAALVLSIVTPFAGRYLWSPYYKIQLEPLTRIGAAGRQEPVTFESPIGYALTVNNDYHQMMLDLRPRSSRHDFVSSWRSSYDYPYREAMRLPDGPILIVGAGTGNDVAAALRNTDRPIVAVEIDPVIARLGRDLHPEAPYRNPRVTLVLDDARSFFQRTEQRFALVVFGFLDSHTLLSSFSSLRLDNFVYTRESFGQVKRLLRPGGRVELTFASNTDWLHHRFVRLMDDVFDFETAAAWEFGAYTNGIVYSNGRALGEPKGVKRRDRVPRVTIPTDEWPFLYLRRPTLPGHYVLFMILALALAASALLFLPRGSRRIRLPYFFLGAAFFLVETSNVVSLSLLYGSTWYVNVLVFTGILVWVLLGNLTRHLLPRVRLDLTFALLAGSVTLSYAVPTSALLLISVPAIRAVAAVLVFLGPVYFASLIFATLIRTEERLDEAYGSNVLGAVLGGVCEYLSLVYGFKFLHALTLLFYLGAFLLGRRSPSGPAAATP